MNSRDGASYEFGTPRRCEGGVKYLGTLTNTTKAEIENDNAISKNSNAVVVQANVDKYQRRESTQAKSGKTRARDKRHTDEGMRASIRRFGSKLSRIRCTKLSGNCPFQNCQPIRRPQIPITKMMISALQGIPVPDAINRSTLLFASPVIFPLLLPPNR